MRPDEHLVTLTADGSGSGSVVEVFLRTGPNALLAGLVGVFVPAGAVLIAVGTSASDFIFGAAGIVLFGPLLVFLLRRLLRRGPLLAFDRDGVHDPGGHFGLSDTGWDQVTAVEVPYRAALGRERFYDPAGFQQLRIVLRNREIHAKSRLHRLTLRATTRRMPSSAIFPMMLIRYEGDLEQNIRAVAPESVAIG
jgi:hypothetical protein